MAKKYKLGIALGSGAARGWVHIGILNALHKAGIEPDIVTGTSIGALVGASYVAGNLASLEHWVSSLTKLETARFFKINAIMDGLVNKQRLHGFLSQYVADNALSIQDIEKGYASVATDLHSGREIWNTSGSLLEAVWASISLPGLFPAIKHDDRWLIDGGLVNPVPVSVCRALGADIVIAVNLNGDILGKHLEPKKKPPEKKQNGVTAKITDFIAEYTGGLFENDNDEEQSPNVFDAIAASVNITQDRITRSRMAGDPPDITLTPRLAEVGLLEFYKAKQAIREGERCVGQAMSELNYLLSRDEN